MTNNYVSLTGISTRLHDLVNQFEEQVRDGTLLTAAGILDTIKAQAELDGFKVNSVIFGRAR